MGIGFIFGALFLLGLFVQIREGQIAASPGERGRPVFSTREMFTPARRSDTVTLAEYLEIQKDMSYAHVRVIIGTDGKEISHSDIAGYTTVMYSWKNPGGSNMNAMFQNDRLITKAQFGLR